MAQKDGSKTGSGAILGKPTIEVSVSLAHEVLKQLIIH
jgi:hypothetical protein